MAATKSAILGAAQLGHAQVGANGEYVLALTQTASDSFTLLDLAANSLAEIVSLSASVSDSFSLSDFLHRRRLTSTWSLIYFRSYLNDIEDAEPVALTQALEVTATDSVTLSDLVGAS